MQDRLDMQGKVVIVTGGAKGVGAGVAPVLRAAGFAADLRTGAFAAGLRAAGFAAARAGGLRALPFAAP